MSAPALSVVLPCFNEALGLYALVAQYKAFHPAISFELILVDNGSTDNTSGVIRDLVSKHPEFLRVVTVPVNRGYGHGLMTGLRAAQAPVLAYSHADSQTPPQDVFRAFQLVTESKVNLDRSVIKGERSKRRDEEKKLTRGLTRIAQLLLGYRLDDINGQPKLFSRKFFERWQNPPLDFAFDVFVLFQARIQGLTITTLPVEFGLRVHGTSTWSASLKSRYKTIASYIISMIRMSIQHYSNLSRFMARLPKWGTAS